MKRRQFLTTTLAFGLALAAAPVLALPEPLDGSRRWHDADGRLHVEDRTWKYEYSIFLERGIYRRCRFILNEIRGDSPFFQECVIWVPPFRPGCPLFPSSQTFYFLNCLLTRDIDEARLADFPEALA